MGGKRCRSRCRHWKGDEAIAPANKALDVMITGAHWIIYSKNAEADRKFLRDVLKFTNADVGHG